MKKSGICKTIGVILLVVFGSIACFFGGVSLIEYGYGWGSEEYLQSSSAQEAVDYHIYNKYGYAISEKKVNDSAVEAFVREISENFDYYVEKYDAKTKSYVSLAESKNYTEDSDYPLVKKYGIGDITNADNRRIFEGDAFENSNAAYIVHVGVNEPTINDDTQFYQRYQVYKMVKPYTENAVTYTVASAAVILILLVYETIAAGHTKEEDGIHLSWIDRIPFDVFTFVMILVGCCICLIGSELLSSISYMMFYEASMDFVEAGLPLIAFVILLALVVYVYYISFVVRIKSHTLISNNVIVKAIQFVYYPVKKVIVEFYDAYCHSSEVWKKVIVGLICISFVLLLIFFVTVAEVGEVFFELFIVILMLAMLYGVWILIKINADTKTLLTAAEKLANGELDYRISEEALNRLHGPFYEHAKNLNLISEGMKKAIENELKSERMKAELITNVSHDIKTPLTSIINYVDLLSKPHEEEKTEEYIDVLQRQSQRLKRLTEDVVEASKASSGNIQVHMDVVSIKEIIEQASAEYEERLKEKNLLLITKIPEEKIEVDADGRLLWRVLRNVFSNASKYSMDGSRVYIDVVEDGENVITTIKNTSKNQLNITEEELMQRFVRGDSSRHTEGSGLGLNIAKSLMDLMQGSFEIQIDGDLFKSIITVKKHEQV